MTDRQVYNCIYRPQNSLVYNMNSAHGIETKVIGHQKNENYSLIYLPWSNPRYIGAFDFLISD